jgi:DNA-binding YbaB/EbfC family protein
LLEGQLGKLLQQAKSMQDNMAKVQNELQNMRVEAVVDSGTIKVVANGRQEIIDIMIDPGIIHPANAGVIQDLMISAVNKALEKSKNLAKEEMNKVTGGLNLSNIPGLFQ